MNITIQTAQTKTCGATICLLFAVTDNGEIMSTQTDLWVDTKCSYKPSIQTHLGLLSMHFENQQLTGNLHWVGRSWEYQSPNIVPIFSSSDKHAPQKTQCVMSLEISSDWLKTLIMNVFKNKLHTHPKVVLTFYSISMDFNINIKKFPLIISVFLLLLYVLPYFSCTIQNRSLDQNTSPVKW